MTSAKKILRAKRYERGGGRGTSSALFFFSRQVSARSVAGSNFFAFSVFSLHTPNRRLFPGGGGVLPIMAYTGRLRPKGVPFSGFRYMKG